MIEAQAIPTSQVEELLAELASAAFQAAQRQKFQGAFIDAELDLWHALRAVLQTPAAAPAGVALAVS